MNDKDYSQITKTVLRKTNIDLANYKAQQMRRRLDGLIESLGHKSVQDFCDAVSRDPDVLARVKTFLTINVSEFYRDSTQFGVLKSRVLPELLGPRGRRLSIWSAGCSHGAEAYSVAMILDELTPDVKHRIVGTDIDQGILERARQGGPFSKSEVKNIGPKLLNKFLEPAKNGYVANKALRDRVSFSRQDLLMDRFSGGYDLILCRNVVIYFTEEAKTRLNHKFYGALKPDGVLFIGGTEALLDAEQYGFERMYPAFYKKAATAKVVSPLAAGAGSRA
ncbi:MAG: protein-glutamate O-methyltransferase CheR [SAR202 cluster bacterium]|nr:protein-glutamate O-methyltransferase CheR [SAR202 cluster bacterium]MDP6713970.1 protein-glutamate O-methyltransferase CheR [SAR202 cluster bacterium]